MGEDLGTWRSEEGIVVVEGSVDLSVGQQARVDVGCSEEVDGEDCLRG